MQAIKNDYKKRRKLKKEKEESYVLTEEEKFFWKVIFMVNGNFLKGLLKLAKITISSTVRNLI